MNYCASECGTAILTGRVHCTRCIKKNQKQRRLRRRNHVNKGDNRPMFGSDGRVAVGQGLSRLKEADRQRWLAEQAADCAAE